ncbi:MULTISPECIES: uroporphyrinogen-III synthase [unclassified Rathayibacter]|uniref:uroporphyrinogen-III synthase n=1 Tax=unclassified Rathayibacter TaxID=2609250 RepID=UPI00188A5D38|nr:MULTISPECIES: uroporphyrinogen-III synthase [unclassified Rathayibacter]MBF4462934.1 uroporphyrinogen-III synthase [Rathayibacter sp. VKM Ac-2879]MBF4504348.1 uroporphyrinogen-III synthase [Rathayibacter sp. VKM Ac-2878]
MTGTDLDASPAFRPDQLDGFRIGVTSDRRSEDLIAAFERRGADVTHAPTIRMRGVDTEGVLEDETRAIVAARPDVLLATTSYGLRRWLEAADAAGLGDGLTAALSSSRILVRGPKARGAVRAAGLDDHGMSERETTTSLVDLALREGVDGSTIAVQLHGFTDPAQLRRLSDAGATVLTVAPYRWTLHEDTARVLRLIEAICGGGIDAVTFTSAPAVEALFTVAEGAGRLDDVQAAFRETVVAAAVGPVTAAPLVEAQILPIVPDRFRMGALIRLLCEHLEQSAPRIETAFGLLELRGRHVVLGSERMPLTPVALALFRTLVAAEGATVARHVLAASAPEALDDHAVDVAISRLRQALPEPRLVATVIKRGYRLATPL